jgi:hypothetical protein
VSAGAELSLEELAMPDLHLIKQEEQVAGIGAGGFASGRSARCVCYIIPDMSVFLTLGCADGATEPEKTRGEQRERCGLGNAGRDEVLVDREVGVPSAARFATSHATSTAPVTGPEALLKLL